MKKRVDIEIQSISDIITNSSSEVFVIRVDDNPLAAKQGIIDYHEIHSVLKNFDNWSEYEKLDPEEQGKYEHGSGMGGELDIYTWEDMFEIQKFKHYIEQRTYAIKAGQKDLPFDEDTYTINDYAKHCKMSLSDSIHCIVIDTDWSHELTIARLWDTSSIHILLAGESEGYEINPETGEIIKPFGYYNREAFKELPKERKLTYKQAEKKCIDPYGYYDFWEDLYTEVFDDKSKIKVVKASHEIAHKYREWFKGYLLKVKEDLKAQGIDC